ncbi:exonuclease domain-containing protein [Eubacterium multiforme]|uniref:Inhibitor of KinA sporulation pathway (Predicted exonuclease) n=1 Tax=Eubacterium multiforme TaxID=83339 RepID=A0ABT9UQZ7_9FIRM|nr:3'-5' exonuclease [Eubacterium multiforme]MDQ0149075.1 inhibitor of KinA sporulation pathway (predicted exonuclease) [Eubacterium multiforme]
MNNEIEAYYYIDGRSPNYNLQYLIKDIKNNKVLIKIRKKLKEENFKIAYYHGLYYVCKNILSLMALKEIANDSKIVFYTDQKDSVEKINKKRFLIKEEYEYIKFFLNKFYSYECKEVCNIKEIIYKEKKPAITLYIKCKKAGKEYKKLIKRNSTLIKLNKYLKSAEELIFFDFEMNCVGNFKDVEIISIGAVKTTLDGEILSQFYSCIKPKNIYRLTDKCIEITSLKQEEIDNAKCFKSVFKEFEKWCGNNNKLFLYWGGNDIAVLKNDSNRIKENIKIVNNIIDFNIDYQEVLCKDILNLNNCLSLKNAVLKYNLTFDGSQHNALDDSYNLSKLYFKETKRR